MNRPGAIIGAGALLVALVAGAVVVLDIPAIVVSRPSSTPSGAGDPPRQPLDPNDILWVWTAQVPFDDARPMVTEYLLQAGTLAGDGLPLVSRRVPWVTAAEDVGRVPAVSAPAVGFVVFASDDGRTSKVARLRIEGGAEPEEVATLPEAVFALELAPDGRRAYLAVVERDGSDGGVIELNMDGSGERLQVMPPSGAGAISGEVLPVALVRLSVQLRLSLDGDQLLRTACGAAGCTSEVVDLRTGRIADVGEGPYLGLAAGSIYRHECDLPPCRIVGVDTMSGHEQAVIEVAAEAALVAVDGRALVVSEDAVARLDQAPALRATDPETGAQRLVGRLGDGQRVEAFGNALLSDARITTPDGVVLVSRSERRLLLSDLAIDLVSGEAIEVPSPLVVPPFGGVNG